MSTQRSLADLRAHEGEVIQVEGSLVLGERGKPLWTLRLDDGEVVVGHLADGSGISWEGLAPFRGRRIAVTARVFFEAIPERYRIFARIGAPYLVDVASIRTLE
jgi:hypothetical protein